VVSSKNGNSITITEFQSDEKGDGLDRVVSSVDVVSHEKVVGIRRVSSNAEQFREIVLQVKKRNISKRYTESTNGTCRNLRIVREYLHKQLQGT
jgi:hypothetical protein